MTQDTRVVPGLPQSAEPPTGKDGAPHPPGYRSIADGELHTAWTLGDYFKSLNTVLRLPAKARKKVEQAAAKTPAGAAMLSVLGGVRVPRGLVMASGVVAVCVLVIRPLVLSASGSGAQSMAPAYGVWQAGKGKYEGRTFELSETTVTFRTSAKNAEYASHRIDHLRAKSTPDSTLFTVTYEEDGKASDFAFWYFSGAQVIRFLHQHDIAWRRAQAGAR